MPKSLNEELCELYLNEYKDLVEELPNDLSPMISQLLGFDCDLKHILDKMDHKMSKLLKSHSVEKKSKQLYKIKKYMKRFKAISEQKLDLSQNLLTKIKIKGAQLTQDYEGILLSDQTLPFTYGTRSGRLWTQQELEKHLN